ncbi:polyprenyl synthetase family protein [Campylobacter fetus]|uniref:Geranyl diphosphate synthase / farnesyl diphosphate synthase n=4 Tax=Campylobacter fetus TaxID=196 RepID=A0AAE6IX63_CAMFE|nr:MULTISPECIES: polyprenyl synthetase family protein [Campylobacter]OCS22493.1 geranyl transferase [Campylobacter fetus subsp. venerealis cfvi97/532]OCS26491.1 geranyl transferase [Campylobacter fetus subsp. venerealis cfvB10]OCS29888.1 geranyl transferase [Campylobacter fetus subsp. venerealis LMG 6570 = CCUG 33900]OCS43225.1 geranyl transferase [Campylobacter fetus subsp. venerealis cfvi02/298]ABK83222.1 geranyltranstransferase [Campylobacter fetus subsp. fetus 82-40]
MSFEEFFELNLPKVDSFHPHFNDSLSWVLKAGGKHFRAKLLLGVVDALKPDLKSASYPVAAAVEMLHTYSLIHDDLPCMDNADLRRGVATLHVKYDEVSAVLAGDALNTHAFYMLSSANLPAEAVVKCVQTLAENGGIYGMVIGQAIDCYFENKHLNLDELKFLHLHKTGALIAASMKMGAIISAQSDKQCEKIYNIGLKLGLAFQIHDDIIDATSDEMKAGKTVNNDLFKNSFTNLMGVNGAIDARDEIENEILYELDGSPLKTLILNLINKYLKG